jgi:hypothetical protein
MQVSEEDVTRAMRETRAQFEAWHPPHARTQLHIDASALLAELGLPADVKYVNVALNPIPSFLALLGLGAEDDGAPEYARTARQLVHVAEMTGGLTNGQTSSYDLTTVNYDLAAIKVNIAHMPADQQLSLENVLAHETIHLSQYAAMKRAGKDPIRESIRVNMEHSYADNPMELDAFKRAPALAHLVKVG